jgi:hypothetical protein
VRGSQEGQEGALSSVGFAAKDADSFPPIIREGIESSNCVRFAGAFVQEARAMEINLHSLGGVGRCFPPHLDPLGLDVILPELEKALHPRDIVRGTVNP